MDGKKEKEKENSLRNMEMEKKSKKNSNYKHITMNTDELRNKYWKEKESTPIAIVKKKTQI